MKFRLEQIAGALGLAVPTGVAGQTIGGCSIDSRTIKPGDLFFALRGPHHDGHAYVSQVLRNGAGAVVVESAFVDHTRDGAGCILRVPNTLDALQSLATWARGKWGGRVVAVTGSAGKTTTKDVIAELLSVSLRTAKSEGNLNNHIGLPLSLLRLDQQAQVAVVEMGMNHAGEIRELARLARPDVGVVTNVGFAHIENFASIEGIAAAKRELVETLAPEGTAVLSADDPRVATMALAHKGRVILYGQSPAAEVRGEEVAFSPLGASFRVGAAKFETALKGVHNVSNILAGIAVAGIFGISPEMLSERVRGLKPGKMRGERLEHNGIVIYNDCYNSNPDATRAMLLVLRDTPAKKRIAVLGEMLELGASSLELHRALGLYAAHNGVDVLIGIQGAAAEMVTAAQSAGLREAFFFENVREAGQFARGRISRGDAVLFKGSRGVRVELALEEFVAPGAAGGRD